MSQGKIKQSRTKYFKEFKENSFKNTMKKLKIRTTIKFGKYNEYALLFVYFIQ